MATMLSGRQALNENIKKLAAYLRRPVLLYASNEPELVISPQQVKERIISFDGIEVSYGKVIRAIAPIGLRNVDHSVFNALRKGMSYSQKSGSGVHILPLDTARTNMRGYNIALMAQKPAEFNRRQGFIHLVDSAQFGLDTNMHPGNGPDQIAPYSYVAEEEIRPLGIVKVGVDDLFSHIWTIDDSIAESDRIRRRSALLTR